MAALFVVAFCGLDHADALAAFAHGKASKAPLRRSGRFETLTGAWTGEYAYPVPLFGVTRVPFNARIEETGASFTGETDEPNTFADPAAPRLFAFLAGARQGVAVHFTKTLDGTGGVNHSILYEGAASADLSRIDGTWRIPGDWSGTFMMERAAALAEAGAMRSTSTEI
jgi:hypothetical protein